MRVLVLGGKLQGVEAAYLARKAGWEVLVLDRKPAPPARDLGHGFMQADVGSRRDLQSFLKGVDLLIPATENRSTLSWLRKDAPHGGTPICFDFSANDITSSKTASNRLFRDLGVPAPAPWPACGFPLVAKPSVGSGSRGVRVLRTENELRKHTGGARDEEVLQQYLPGPQFSIEVVGRAGHFHALQTTELEMDRRFDCKRVRAPVVLHRESLADFEAIAVRLAAALPLAGLMDVEAVFHHGQFKVLEIDARLPSQTPTAVWWSSGLNILELSAACFLPGGDVRKPVASQLKGVVYEHIRVAGAVLEVAGEHIMAAAGPLHVQRDFFGADEALTNYSPNRPEWVATLIVQGETGQEAWEKRTRVISDIQRRFGLERILDNGPFE